MAVAVTAVAANATERAIANKVLRALDRDRISDNRGPPRQLGARHQCPCTIGATHVQLNEVSDVESPKDLDIYFAIRKFVKWVTTRDEFHQLLINNWMCAISVRHYEKEEWRSQLPWQFYDALIENRLSHFKLDGHLRVILYEGHISESFTKDDFSRITKKQALADTAGGAAPHFGVKDKNAVYIDTRRPCDNWFVGFLNSKGRYPEHPAQKSAPTHRTTSDCGWPKYDMASDDFQLPQETEPEPFAMQRYNVAFPTLANLLRAEKRMRQRDQYSKQIARAARAQNKQKIKRLQQTVQSLKKMLHSGNDGVSTRNDGVSTSTTLALTPPTTLALTPPALTPALTPPVPAAPPIASGEGEARGTADTTDVGTSGDISDMNSSDMGDMIIAAAAFAAALNANNNEVFDVDFEDEEDQGFDAGAESVVEEEDSLPLGTSSAATAATGVVRLL